MSAITCGIGSVDGIGEDEFEGGRVAPAGEEIQNADPFVGGDFSLLDKFQEWEGEVGGVRGADGKFESGEIAVEVKALIAEGGDPV